MTLIYSTRFFFNFLKIKFLKKKKSTEKLTIGKNWQKKKLKNSSIDNCASPKGVMMDVMKVHILDTIKLFLLVKYWIKNKLYKKLKLQVQKKKILTSSIDNCASPKGVMMGQERE